MADASARTGIIFAPTAQKKRHVLLFRVIAVLLALSVLFFLINLRFHSYLVSLGSARADRFFSETVNDAVSYVLPLHALSYEDIIHLTFKDSGDVASLSADMVKLSTFKTAVCQTIFKTFYEGEPFLVRVPLLSVFGLDMLQGADPHLDVRIEPARFLHVYYTSEFKTVGINQTLHRIVLHIEGSLTLLLPQGKEDVFSSGQFCLAETVIVGRVPDAYTEINRLSDEIIEQDIDDIYDFGATLD